MAQEEPGGGPPIDWCLTDRYGQRQRLPKTMIFLGREECDIILQSDTVDKRHAVVTFDHYLNKFKIKDLSTVNGTFINDHPITEQTYVTLEHLDRLRLGFDPTVYHVERMDKLGSCGLPAVIPQGKPPAWASRHLTHMAECKGCIAEQQIHHTCGVHASHDHSHDAAPAHLTCNHGKGDENGVEDYSGYNTWPRKGERLKMQPPVQKEALPPTAISTDITTSSQCSTVSTDNQSSYNSAISKDIHISHDPAMSCKQTVMYKDAIHSKQSRNTQDPLIDGNIMKPERDTNNSKKGDQAVEGKTTDSKDLERSMKGTPLYGQPAWWGEDEDKHSITNGSTQNKQITEDMSFEPASKETIASINWGYDPQKYKSDPKYSQRYMEIPARDTDPGLESPVYNNEASASLLSRDSLSPVNTTQKDIKEDSLEKDLPPVTDKLPKSDASAMAFTVDLGDEKPNKKLNMSGSLSEFVPSKIRRSFRERSEKASTKVTKDENVQREIKESTPVEQRKLDELWGSAGEIQTPAAVDGGDEESDDDNDEEEVDMYEDLKTHKKDIKSPRQSQVFDTSTYKKSKPQSTRTVLPVSTSADVPVSDPANFLIDKMFESSAHSRGGHLNSDIISPNTEHCLYKESAHHDNILITKSLRMPKTDPDLLKPKKSSRDPQISKGKACGQKSKENVIDAEEEDEIQVEEDKTSEAGTYTIELDDTTKTNEEKVARESIDKLFGVGQELLHRPVVGIDETFVRHDRSIDDETSVDQLEQVEEDLDRLEWQRADGGGILSSMEVEVGSGYDHQAMKSLSMPAPGAMIKQRTFLLEGPSQSSPNGTKSSSSKDSLNSMSPSERPPSGQRKRPGTGRKLPSLPPDKGSPRSDSSPRLSDIVQRSRDFSPRGDSLGMVSPVQRDKSVTISNQVSTHEARLDSTRSGSTSDVTLTNVSSLSSQSNQTITGNKKADSARSLASIDTEILLRDTETVMAAMEARMVSRQRGEDPNKSMDCDSDTDVSSTVAEAHSDTTHRSRQSNKVVNQRLSKVKPQQSKSSAIPKQEYVPRLQESPVSLGSLNRKLSLPCDSDRSVASDVLSDADNDSISVRSDASTDYSESSPKPSRKGSKGKGNITMTRPNRAFQLRRLRAEGSTESPEPPKSDSSHVTTSTPKSTGRPVSGRSSRPNSTGFPSDRKSDASLGTAIANKGKQNAAASQQNFARKDGGRHSLRSARSTTSTSSSKSTVSSGGSKSSVSTGSSKSSVSTASSRSTVSAKSGSSTSTVKSSTSDSIRKKEIRDLKTHLKGKPELSITGVSQKSRSQPPSRSNSPKTAERNAWKRRKEYDPRKAVAQAKAKAKASSNPPPAVSKLKQSSIERSLQKMSRSASYTNPDDFNKFGRESMGREPMGDSMSSDDLNASLNNEAEDRVSESRFKRPLRSRGAKSMTSIRDQSGHSGDENSSSLSEDSQDVCYGMLGLRPYKSAFTPPLKSRSPASPSLSPPSRRANNSHDLYSAKSIPRLANRHSTELHSQSYDNLIISSIYQLSLKLKTSTDRTLEKLSRDNRRVSGSPSPVFELNNQGSAGEIPAWNAANQELAAILKNLRKMDHRMQVINRALFPGEEAGTESSRLTNREKKQYLQEIQRIHELAGFRPIDNPEQVWRVDGDGEEEEDDNTSNVSEVEEFVEDFY